MRILHTMLRVGDLDKSIDFYVNRLGMNLLRKKDYPHGKFTLAFVGYGSEKENAVIEYIKIHSVNIKIIEPNSTMGNILKRYEIIIKAMSISNAWHALYLTK